MPFDYAEATKRIAEYEGNLPRVYKDQMGHPTVGIGFNLDRGSAAAALEAVGANYEAVRAGTQSLTSDQIQALVKKDIDDALSHAESAVPNFSSLSPARQFVIVDMIFNMGSAGFGQFHHTIASIDSGNFQAAADGMKQSAWYGQVGPRAVKDVGMMLSGEWDGTEAPAHEQPHAQPHETPAHEQHAPPSHSGPAYPGEELREGICSEEARVWQERLKELGHDVQVDGEFGPHTEEATKQFQRDKGLTEDGIVGPHTWAAAWS